MKRALVVAMLSLCACGGGAGSGVGGTAVMPPALTSQAVLHLHLGVPAGAVTPKIRPKRVSSAVLGVGIVVYFHSDATHSMPVGSAAYDASASSPRCTVAASGSRSCTFDVPAPVPSTGDSDDVVITTYDTVPSGGAIPPSANALDQGSINVTPVAGGSLSPAVVFDGIPATVTIAVQNPNAAYDTNLYGGMSYFVQVVAQDASGAAIIGSDPYATPIQLSTIGTLGGSGTPQFARQPASATPPPVTTFNVTQPGQAVYVSAPAKWPTMYVDATSPAASFSTSVNKAGTTQTIANVAGATQLQAGTDGFVYVPDATTAHVYDPKTLASAGTVAAGAAQNFYGISPMAPGSDATGAVLIGYANLSGTGFAFVGLGSPPDLRGGDALTTGFPQPVSAGSLQFYTHNNDMCNVSASCAASAGGTQAVLGSDGNMWVAAGGVVRRVTLDLATITNFSTGLTAGANVESIVSASDGNLYALDDANGQVVQITTSGTISTFNGSGASGNIIAGPDGGLWFPCSSGIARFDLTTHAVTTITLSFTPVWMTLAADRAFWTIDGSGNVDRVIP